MSDCKHIWSKWKFTFEPGDGSYHWERQCTNCKVGQVTHNDPGDTL